MSYILDALKRSEQARGSRKTRWLLEGSQGAAAPIAQPRRRLGPFLIAAILFLNAGLYVFWLRQSPTPAPSSPTPGRTGERLQAGTTTGAKTPDTAKASPGSRPGGHEAGNPPAPQLQTSMARPAGTEGPGEGDAAAQQATQAIAPPPLSQKDEKQETAEDRLEKTEQTPGNPSASEGATAIANQPPATGTQTPDAVQNRIADNRTAAAENSMVSKGREPVQDLKSKPAPSDQAAARHAPTTQEFPGRVEPSAKKPDSSKSRQVPKTAETKKGLKTANLQEPRKPHPPPADQPARSAAGSGIISDIQPLAELGAKSGRPPALPEWNDLAPQIRDSIPGLSFSMLIYSKKPDQRWININGSKRREGDEISAGLKLEEITPDGAIFSYLGTRFYKGVIGN